MRIKLLLVFRTRSIGVEEKEMAPDLALAPETIWEPSTMMEEQIQALATRELLKPKMEVAWRPAGVPHRGDQQYCRLPHAHRA
jgi:hypothetical protein